MIRRGAGVAAAVLLLAGCTTAVVMRNPATGETVDCTARAAAAVPPRDPLATGRGNVPAAPAPTPTAIMFDHVHRCTAMLMREGWVCQSGCPTP